MAGWAQAGPVAVVSDGAGVAEALLGELARRGFSASVRDASDVGGADAVIVLSGLRDVAGDGLALAAVREGFVAAKQIAAAATERGGIFVTVQDTGGDFGLAGSDRAFFGGLAGLAKTADLEWGKASVKAIDLERGGRSPQELAAAIADELFAGGPEIEVGLHADGRRTTLQSVLADLPRAARLPLGEGDVVVCSGGARGVTAATMIALAERTRATMILLGRTQLVDEPASCVGVDEAGLKGALMMAAKEAGEKVSPAAIGKQASKILAQREIRSTLAALEAHGSMARYVSVDVTNAAGVARALDQVRSDFGSITAVVHGAGVVADKLIADKPEDAYDWVVSTKIDGLQALLSATAHDPLKVLAFFSSVAARTGNVGQCDYAVANEILNKVAAREARRRPDCVVTSLGWGPWEAGMVTPSLKAYFEEHGVALIPLEVGGQMLCDELGDELGAADRTSTEVVLGGTPRRASIAGENSAQRMDLFLGAKAQPYLHDHSIDGVAVLPVVMVLEYFARAAEALTGRKVVALTDVEVFRGVPLPDFDGAGHWLRVMAEVDGDAVKLFLCDADDERRRRYGAVAQLGEVAEGPSVVEAAHAYQPLSGALYGGSLFHGPAFQVIRELDGVAPDAIAGTLEGVHGRGWPGRYRTDPALLDGGLQLAVRWAEEELGGHGLPTGVKALRLFTDAPVEGPLRTCATIVERSPTGVVGDVDFVDADQRLVARLEQVSIFQRPG